MLASFRNASLMLQYLHTKQLSQEFFLSTEIIIHLLWSCGMTVLC